MASARGSITENLCKNTSVALNFAWLQHKTFKRQTRSANAFGNRKMYKVFPTVFWCKTVSHFIKMKACVYISLIGIRSFYTFIVLIFTSSIPLFNKQCVYFHTHRLIHFIVSRLPHCISMKSILLFSKTDCPEQNPN